MEIQEIKSKLTLSQVLHHYHLKPDKNMRMCCPFHSDKTPSFQVYYKTHTAYCFSTNCPTHGKSIDVIDFIMYKEKGTKHEAILIAKYLIDPVKYPLTKPVEQKEEIKDRERLLTKMFTYFRNGVHNSKPAKAYLQKRSLDFTKTEVGYNSGQFHHGKRKDESLIKSCIEFGLLLDLGNKGRTGNPAYKAFGKWCIVFALRNRGHEIVGLYFRSTLQKKDQRHFYLRNRQGLYPCYPSIETKRLILTESIIDAASLLEVEGIRSRPARSGGGYKVLALYGTNGLTEEHQEAIKEIENLEEIIFFLNGDEAGKKAVDKYAPMLKGEYPGITISKVEVPENEDVNSLLQSHSCEILIHLIKTRKEYDFLFSAEIPIEPVRPPGGKKGTELLKSEKEEEIKRGLDTNNPYNLKYKGNEARYQIKGFKMNQLDSLKITLQITTE